MFCYVSLEKLSSHKNARFQTRFKQTFFYNDLHFLLFNVNKCVVVTTGNKRLLKADIIYQFFYCGLEFSNGTKISINILDV